MKSGDRHPRHRHPGCCRLGYAGTRRALADIVHSDSIASHYGAASAICVDAISMRTVLGALSDRFGRRPVLLASLLGATIDYAIMATTPVLWISGYSSSFQQNPSRPV